MIGLTQNGGDPRRPGRRDKRHRAIDIVMVGQRQRRLINLYGPVNQILDAAQAVK